MSAAEHEHDRERRRARDGGPFGPTPLDEGPLDEIAPTGDRPPPADVAPDEEPPVTSAGRETTWVAGHDPGTRDITPALGTPGRPAPWRRAVEGAHVALQRRDWGDARWSYLFDRLTKYGTQPLPDEVAQANRRGRMGPMPPSVQGPFVKPPVWTWEVPLYFWIGGVASGSAFVGLACDLAGDERSARTARVVALAAIAPAPLLLISDLGRPGRFLNMLRIFKPRSPMNLGAWCLVAFSTVDGAAVAADVLRLRPVGRALGALGALLAGYLGSYTGVLLATTAVPLWARSRLLLGPIFVATASATGAAATRLVLVARGLPEGHPTRTALGAIETGAMLAEFSLSMLNERRLLHAGRPLESGRPALLFRIATTAVASGLLLHHVARPRLGPRAHHAASVLYLAGGMAYRYAWVEAGKASARDDEAVARMARGRVTAEDVAGVRPVGGRTLASVRSPLLADGARTVARAWTEGMRRASLLAERVLTRAAG